MAVPMNSDEDDASAMKALAKEHDLSIRGAIATKPPFSYMRAFFDAMMDPHDADANPRGYVNLAVAQNHLTIEPVQYRLRQSFVDAPLPDSACGYDNMRGSERLRVAIAKHETRMFGGDVSPEQLCVSAGAGAVIDNLFMAIASEGDGVLIPAPYYPAFDNDLRVRNGVRAIAVHGDDAASLPTPSQLADAAEAAEAKGVRIRALLITNPSNPLGVVYTQADLAERITWALTHDLHCVVDEVYASSVFNFDRKTRPDKKFAFFSALNLEKSGCLAVPSAKCKTYLHHVYGMSKDFCASGYRIGVLRTRNEGVLRAMDNVGYFCAVPGPMQHAVAEMLEDEEWVDTFIAHNAVALAESHKVLTDALKAFNVPVVHAIAGMFVWIDLSGWLKAPTWEEERRLWTAATEDPRCKLVMTPGRDCKCKTPGCFRLCFAAVPPKTLEVAAARLKALLDAYE